MFYPVVLPLVQGGRVVSWFFRFALGSRDRTMLDSWGPGPAVKAAAPHDPEQNQASFNTRLTNIDLKRFYNTAYIRIYIYLCLAGLIVE